MHLLGVWWLSEGGGDRDRSWAGARQEQGTEQKGEDGEELGADFYMGRFSALLQATHMHLQSVFSLEFHIFETLLILNTQILQSRGMGGGRGGGKHQQCYFSAVNTGSLQACVKAFEKH